ncbi:MAG: queuosine precursor transporter [Pseudomonadota bacterium]
MTDKASAKGAFAPYDTKDILPINVPTGLFSFLILYGGMTVLAGVVAYKQVQLWPSPLAVEAGIFPFLLLVVISSTISQLYGRAMATRLVWWGFVPLGLSAAIIFLVLVLPASPDMLATPDRQADLAAFERVLGQTPRILMAGPAAYITSLLLNIWIFDRLRGSGEATTFGLMVRGAVASALSQAIDSVIFITLAFYGEFPITNLLIGQVLAKVTLSIVLVPFLITFGVRAATWLDQRSGASVDVQT